MTSLPIPARLLLLLASCHALQVSNIFTDDMVLQHSRRTSVYGSCEPSNHVHLSLFNADDVSVEMVTSSCDADGTWKAVLSPVSPGVGYSVRVTATKGEDANDFVEEELTLLRVAFGDVYFCGGQSNMALPLVHTFSFERIMGELRRNTTKSDLYNNVRMFRYGQMNERHEDDHPVFVRPASRDDRWFNMSAAIKTKPVLGEHSHGQAVATLLQSNIHKFTASARRLSSLHDPQGPKPPSTWIENFSATCFYFAAEVIQRQQRQGQPVLPIGLIQSAVGGTTIEEWMDAPSLTKCTNQTDVPHPKSGLFNGMVAPFVNHTVAGFVWYQGENNVLSGGGNSKTKQGYGCEMPELIRSWRGLWSATPQTTDPVAPFVIVSIASGGDEGHGLRMGVFRWGQTANYGVAPNPEMEKVAIAQAYDAGDPWDISSCFGTGCCKPSMTPITPDDNPEKTCLSSVPSWTGQDWFRYPNASYFMGAIHPRDKLVLGTRIATAMAGLNDNSGQSPKTGPTIKSCSVHGSQLDISFDEKLMGQDSLEYSFDQRLQPFSNQTISLSTISVCFEVHPKMDNVCDCIEWVAIRNTTTQATDWRCRTRVDGPQLETEPLARATESEDVDWRPSPNPYIKNTWFAVQIDPSKHVSKTSITVDLGPLVRNGVDVSKLGAVRYAWTIDSKEDRCCRNQDFIDGWMPCPPGSCPIRLANSKLPANPFFARIKASSCECPLPQLCN